MKNCHGCEKETLNPHEDINKNESIDGTVRGMHYNPLRSENSHHLKK